MAGEGKFDWAGVPFLAVGMWDAERMRGPGLYAFVRRLRKDERIMLFVDHADCVALAAQVGHPHWDEAMRLGMNEIHVCLRAHERIDRLILRRHLVRRVVPILNLVGGRDAGDEVEQALCA